MVGSKVTTLEFLELPSTGSRFSPLRGFRLARSLLPQSGGTVSVGPTHNQSQHFACHHAHSWAYRTPKGGVESLFCSFVLVRLSRSRVVVSRPIRVKPSSHGKVKGVARAQEHGFPSRHLAPECHLLEADLRIHECLSLWLSSVERATENFALGVVCSF